MALINIEPILFGPKSLAPTSPTSVTLDAAGEYVAYAFSAPKSGTIDRVHFYAGAVTADGDGLRIRIEPGDATVTAPHLPTGTLLSGSSEVTDTVVTPNSWNRSPAGLGAVVVAGEPLFAKLLSTGGTPFNGVIRTAVSAGGSRPMVDFGGAWSYHVQAIPTPTAQATQYSVFALEYDDGSIEWVMGAVPPATLTNTNYNNASTPDERGNRIVMPGRMRVIGIWSQTLLLQDTEFVLYDDASSVLRVRAWDKDVQRVNGGGGPLGYMFEPIILDKDQLVRVIDKPITASSITGAHYTIDTAVGGTALRNAMRGSAYTQLTTRTDAGAWTDLVDAFHCNGLIVDQVEDGAGGGAVIHPGMAGGMRG